MPQSVSMGEFTKSVQSAVKEAAARHPEFKVDMPKTLSLRILIWGFPIPDGILKKVSVADAQLFATDVAKGIGAKHAGLGKEGTLFTSGGHLIVGIPPVFEGLEFGP